LNRITYWFARAALVPLEYLPLSAALIVARFYTRVLDVAVPRLRKSALRNLELARMTGGDAVVGGVFRSIARILVSVARFPRIDRSNISSWIEYEGFEHYQEAKRRGRGVLFATAHLGNWELSAFAHSLMAEPMNVVVRPLDHPLIDALVERRRTMSGNRVIGKKDAARRILRALRANEAVGILVDQNVVPEEGVFVDFFGVKACAGSVFVKLAHHSGATVLPGFALWCADRKRYVLKFFPPLEMSGDVQADTQRLHSQLESVIREYPDQWMWLHRRWKTRPAGEASFDCGPQMDANERQ
jgi:Kdo2-lipid IVA lauroyltransferase/acyltransferase